MDQERVIYASRNCPTKHASRGRRGKRGLTEQLVYHIHQRHFRQRAISMYQSKHPSILTVPNHPSRRKKSNPVSPLPLPHPFPVRFLFPTGMRLYPQSQSKPPPLKSVTREHDLPTQSPAPSSPKYPSHPAARTVTPRSYSPSSHTGRPPS